ncbi:LysR family transcriptional regulator [Acinetobacter indicus]|uniref:LysR family transcriptional regulator n=1 Tax=Acinetobacter indicus TaxID=756892 RepID=UPI0032B5A0F7
MRLDLADFQLFICIIEAGSITGGAIKANLALSSASERLRHMEADVGVPLLVRHPRGVTPTEAGETLAKYARQIIYQHELLKTELKNFTSGMRGTLRLYANTSALTEFLPSKIASWLKTHPDIHIDLEERSSTDIIKSISAGLGEAGIVSNAVDPQTLKLEPLVDDHLSLIIPINHRLNGEQAVFLKDIIHEPFVGFYPGSALQEHINIHASSMGYELIVRIRMNTFEGMCEMVANGIGLGILPEVIADKYQTSFKYKKLTLKDEWAKRQLCITYQCWEDLSSAMKNLLNYLKLT